MSAAEAAEAAELGGAAAAAEAVEAAEAAEAARRVMARGLRLFGLYVAAGGGLCMRGVVWRKIMPALHPDRRACVMERLALAHACKVHTCTHAKHMHIHPAHAQRILHAPSHPRGGDVQVFQHVHELKRKLDAGEVRAEIGMQIYEPPTADMNLPCACCACMPTRIPYGLHGR